MKDMVLEWILLLAFMAILFGGIGILIHDGNDTIRRNNAACTARGGALVKGLTQLTVCVRPL